MSTDHQKYSTENQRDAIQQYADKHQMQIVRTYADEGKSGLNLEGRAELKRLLNDIQSGQVDFEAVLVYDVSRWGRFQDVDESAYYEYLCRRAGIRLVFCAEQFENDGSLPSTIMKTLKRGMAGEYSRELSTKVFIGQCRQIELGHRQGGSAGYGLRRLLIDEQRNPKLLLARGERKSLQTDRVILVPGPDDEVAVVRRIYQMFVVENRVESEIAGILNRDGYMTDLNRPWTRGTIHQILTNEKYIGNNVYNRSSFKLKKKRVNNPPDMWVRADAAFEGVVDTGVFERARTIILERSKRMEDSEMLALLRRLLGMAGILSGLIIDEQDHMPSSSAYRSRFGSLLRAYSLIGFHPFHDYRYIEVNRALRRRLPEVIQAIVEGFQRASAWVTRNPTTDLLNINEEFSVSIVIARCKQTVSGSYRWRIRFDTSQRPDITVVVRMAANNEVPLDYYLFPCIDMPLDAVRLSEKNGLSLDAYRFDSLDLLYALGARIDVEEAA